MYAHAECMPPCACIGGFYKGVGSISADCIHGGELGRIGDRVDERSNAKRRKTAVTNVVPRGGENSFFCADGQTKKSKIGGKALARVCTHTTSATPNTMIPYHTYLGTYF